MVKKELKPEGYAELLKDIKSILQKGLTKAYKAVDNIKVQTYWQVGERVVREELQQKNRADYGKKIIALLAPEIGIDEQTLRHIIRFYRTYPILSAVRRELSWTHYKTITYLINKEEMLFYESQSVINGWSTRELEKRIKNKEYEKARKKGEITIKPPLQLPSPEDVFKESYNWDFISLEQRHTEKDLEEALLNNIQKVLLEFGHGFAFLGRQQKALINNNWHKIDLLFYHILLKCHIVVDLKARTLMHGDIEQVTKYLTYFREKKIESDRDPIALIICKSHDKIDVYYSAGKDKDDIFIAEYKTKLPSEQEIISKLKESNKE